YMLARRFSFGVSCLALCVTSLVVAGCGKSQKTYPVEGSVTYPDGKPLVGGSVEFESQEAETKGLNARGDIGADGSYRLKTGKDDGAVEGSHRVIVVPPPYPPSNMD